MSCILLMIFMIGSSVNLGYFPSRFLKCYFHRCIRYSWLAAFSLSLAVLLLLLISFTVSHVTLDCPFSTKSLILDCLFSTKSLILDCQFSTESLILDCLFSTKSLILLICSWMYSVWAFKHVLFCSFCAFLSF